MTRVLVVKGVLFTYKVQNNTKELSSQQHKLCLQGIPDIHTALTVTLGKP